MSFSWFKRAGFFASYCFYNRFEDCDFADMAIGIHSACNNLRVSGTDIHSTNIAGILIDGGASIEIEGNLIEGNGGPSHPRTLKSFRRRLRSIFHWCFSIANVLNGV